MTRHANVPDGHTTCPTCEGECGTLVEGGDRGEWLFEDCPMCEGVGFVQDDDTATSLDTRGAQDSPDIPPYDGNGRWEP